MILCACGCGGEIIIKPRHKYDGIPKYITGHWGRGKSFSPERCENISKSLEGRHPSEKTKQKISQSMKNKCSEEDYKLKMSNCQMGNTSGRFNKGIPKSEKHKQKLADANKGKKRSDKTKKKISNSKKGNTYCLGRILSDKTKQKISDAHYKGGKKLSNARHTAARKQFGFIPLNSCEVDGWVGHHIDLNYVIFIPEKLHKSIYHSITKDINMNIINDKVYDWFVNYYLKGITI